MLTTALEHLVIPVLKEAAYSVKRGALRNTVLFVASNQYGIVPGAVVDYPNLNVLAIIVSFPRLGTSSLSMTNTLNRKGLGKVTVDGKGRLDYVLELPYTEETTPQAFAHSLALALGTVESLLQEQGAGVRRNRRKHQRKAHRHSSKPKE